MVTGPPRAGSEGTIAPATDDRRPSHRTLRDELAHLYAATYDRTIRHDTLHWLEQVVAYLLRLQRSEGDLVLRSLPQAFRGIGWPVTGEMRHDKAQYATRLKRWLNMLVDMGVLESWEPVYRANGEGRGILIRLSRSSSAGRALRPSAPSRGRSRASRGCSSSRRVSPPLREKVPSDALEGSRSSRKTLQARATRAREGRAGHRATARAIQRLTAAGEGTGFELVAALPELKALQPAVLLRVATYVFAPQPSAGWAKHWKPLLSEQSRHAAEAAYDQLDRYDGRGAGAVAIIDLAAGGWRLHTPLGRPPRFAEPRTPGLLVKGLRQRARAARRAARMRDELYAASEGWS